MGLFSDRCSVCGGKVKKAAHFCSKCGRPAPGSWTKCPGCGKWVGSDSNACPYCGKPLHPEERQVVAGGTWQRQSGQFAQLLDVSDIRQQLKKGFMIQSGTSAILMDAGRIKDVLRHGAYNLNSIGHRINSWGSPPPRTVVLVDAGDVELQLPVDGLRSSEEIAITLYAKVVFGFQEKGADKLLENFLKEKRQLTYDDIAEKLLPEVRYAAQNYTNTSTIEDLLKDPYRRLRLEDELANVLGNGLERLGLHLVRVAALDFTSPEYEELREKSADVEVKRRQLEFDERMRELLSEEKRGEFKNEKDLEEYVAQLTHEKQVKDDHREHELNIVRQVYRQEITAKDAEFQMDRETKKIAHEIDVDKLRDEYQTGRYRELLKLRKEKEQVRLETKEKEQEVERKHVDELAKIFAGKDIEVLISVLPEDKRADLLKLRLQSAQAGLKPEEILAQAAADSPQAAEALKAFFESSGKEAEERLEKDREMLNQTADRMERIMKEALQAISNAAKGSKGSTTVIK